MLTSEIAILEETNSFDRVLRPVINSINWIVKVVNSLFGLTGLVVLTPLLAIGAFAFWLTLVRLNYKLERRIAKFFSSIDSFDKRELMKHHGKIRQRKIEGDAVLKSAAPLETLFFFKPIIGQMKHGRKIFNQAEERLRKTLYPQAYQPLSEEQKNQLLELSKNFESIKDDHFTFN